MSKRKYWYETNFEGEKVRYSDTKRVRTRRDKEGNIHVPVDKEYFTVDGNPKYRMDEFVVSQREYEKFIKYQKRYNKERKKIMKERIKQVESFDITKAEKENAIYNLKHEYAQLDLKLTRFTSKKGFDKQSKYMQKHSTKTYLSKANSLYKRNYLSKLDEVFDVKYSKKIRQIIKHIDGGELFALRSSFDCLGLDFLYDDIQQQNKYNQIMSAFERLGYTKG